MSHGKNNYVGAFDTTDSYIASGWAGNAVASTVANGVPFETGAVFGSAGVTADFGPVLTTLVSFKGVNGARPDVGLIADAAGDLFGVTSGGGANHHGTVFEIKKTADGYASYPTVLINFTIADGATPQGSLIIDAAGDLFGTTSGGGADNDGTVFEITKTSHGYASAPTTLVSFTGADGSGPLDGLIMDAAGDLFGTTPGGGADNDGTVFEITKTSHGYASAPTTLVSFTGADGTAPVAGLFADAAGDLFGTTNSGGADNFGTVFEITKTRHGYASAPTTLVSFTDADGAFPVEGLIMDAAGDLFGTTFGGGADGDGTVFEITKTSHGYASAPTTLVSFTGADGSDLIDGLIMDAAGDLFGSTFGGGADNDGTVFEIVKTRHGYASAPTTLVSFTGADGSGPRGDLIANAAGDLFGTTFGGGKRNNNGTVFEITNSGFVPPAVPAAPAADIPHSSATALAFAHSMAGLESGRSGTIGPTVLTTRGLEAATVLARPQPA